MRKSARIAVGVGVTGLGALALAFVVLIAALTGFAGCEAIVGPLDGGLGFESEPQCGGRDMRAPAAPEEYGTPAEICTRGDLANPGDLYAEAYPSDAETQERVLAHAARFSGYTTWMDDVTLVPASRFVDGYPGEYVRIEVRIFNRDAAQQSVGARDFALWRDDEGFRRADHVGASDALADSVELESGATLAGAVYLYAGDAHGDLFVRYDPDAFGFSGGASSAVWHVVAGGAPLVAQASTATTTATTAPGAVPDGRDAVVDRVVDGDTIVVDDGERIRFTGIDTPETVKLGSPIECFGKAASRRMTTLLPEGTAVRLVRDADETDRYDRTLSYVYRLDDGLFVNAAMVRDGYAYAYTVPPNVAHAAEFVALQAEARAAERGLWAACPPPD